MATASHVRKKAEEIMEKDGNKKMCGREKCDNRPGCYHFRRKLHTSGSSLYHIIGCRAKKLKPNPGKKELKKDSSSTPPSANVVQVDGYTVTPEASPTVQLADQMVSVATSSIVPTDWHASKRYFSVLGTGVDEEGDSAVIIAIKDVPRHSTGASVVENDAESETLRRKKRA